MKWFRQKVADYGVFLRHRWRLMLALAVVGGLMVEGLILTSSAVRQITENATQNRLKLERLIEQADRNGRELECIKRALGLEATISRDEFDRCQRETDAPAGPSPVTAT